MYTQSTHSKFENMKLESGRVVLSSLLLLSLSLLCITSISGGSASAVSKDLLIGVAPQDEEYYRGAWSSKGTLKCKDGSNHFTKSQLNDDFCDCPDGSDEPGTSACPNGKFYCRNAGHIPLTIYSSQVNDGICDCCDGSDEYDGKIKCPNTCWEAGKVARDKLKKKIATYQEGITIRKREVEQAKLAIAKEEAELSKLKDEEKILKGLVEQLKGRKEQIERAEEKERLQKEKEEKERKEAEEAKLKENKAEDKADVPEDDPDAVEDHGNSVIDSEHTDEITKGPLGNGVEQVEEEDGVDRVKENSPQHLADEEGTQGDDKAGLDTKKEEKAAIENTESLSREELGRLVASRWTGEKAEEQAEEQTEEAPAAKNMDHENHDDSSAESLDEEYNRYDSEDEEHKYDDDDDDSEEPMEDFGVEDTDDSSSSYKSEADDEPDMSDITNNPSWLEKIQKAVQRIFEAVNFFQGPVDKSEAERVRKEYEESSAKLSKIQSRISSLTKKLKQDFGPEKEFYSFYGQCFESKQNKYVYKICPFKEASQTEGYSTTRLGNWEKFDDSYRAMQFSNGDRCWNGPDRSMKVKLRCGLKNEVSDVDEPSRCEYLALMSSPALCVEEKLKELQDKLDMMNKEQPQGHDEL